jgi:hypothetical protein
MKKLTTVILNELKEFNHFFKEQEIPAKTILLPEGQISKTMFFIEKGCLRTWINNDGKEITTQFFFEGDGVSSFESFRTNQPSLYSIESIEPCILKSLSQKDFQTILKSTPELRIKLEDHLFKRLFQSQQLLYSFLKNNQLFHYQIKYFFGIYFIVNPDFLHRRPFYIGNSVCFQPFDNYNRINLQYF